MIDYKMEFPCLYHVKELLAVHAGASFEV